jgi:hypothetical protein
VDEQLSNEKNNAAGIADSGKNRINSDNFFPLEAGSRYRLTTRQLATVDAVELATGAFPKSR